MGELQRKDRIWARHWRIKGGRWQEEDWTIWKRLFSDQNMNVILKDLNFIQQNGKPLSFSMA